MLKALHIKNIVLIEQLDLVLEDGLCALTGETGAGKSILLDSLGLALGRRSDSGLVRKGADKASVSVEFELPKSHPVQSLLTEHDLESGDLLILRRIVNKDGRSRAFVNDQPVGASFLKIIGNALVEIHGQFDTQGLLNVKTHLALLDSYAAISTETKRIEILYVDWMDTKVALGNAQSQAEKSRMEETYLRQSVEDLDMLDPKEEEEQKLANLREFLKHREQIIQAFHMAQETLSGEGGAENSLNQAWRALDNIVDKAGDTVRLMLETLDRASSEIQEAVTQIDASFSDMEDGEHNLENIDDRLYALRAQARKHDCSVDDLPKIRETLSRKLDLINGEGDVLGALQKKVTKARSSYISLAQTIHEKRKELAAILDKNVAKELPPLKLDKARFVTHVKKMEEPDWRKNGFDQVRFLVATNPKADPAPLNKIASGGEMARFMLALKVVMAETGISGTLVFDEVDSGIGGATADAVGERLSRLSKKHQILVVTHSPQVAARADYHWIVEKYGEDDVRTNIMTLENIEKRREEIARMLSGANITQEARAAAEKLLER